VPLLILTLTYAVLALGRVPWFRIDRTGAAIIGAIAMVAAGGLPFDEAVRAIDARTIVLLFGMMVLVAHLRLSGFFSLLAHHVAIHLTHPVALLAAVIWTSGVLSALFVNDTICLVFTPIVIASARQQRRDAVPYLVALATASNIGSVATITGNPQNMLIGTVSGISYASFAGALGPVAVLGLAIDTVLIWAIWRRRLAAQPNPVATGDCPPATGERAAADGERLVAPGDGPLTTSIGIVHTPTVHRAMLWKTLAVAAGMLAGFLAGFDTALVAACGAAVLLVTRRVKPQRVYRQVDWDLLVLFIGLFVVVEGARHAGLSDRLFALLTPLGIDTVAGLSATAAILSNAISNVPAVMLLAHVVPSLPDARTSWLTLAMASTLAGNLTLVASIANVIVAESARRQGVTLTFREHARIGVPVTVATIAIGVAMLGL
jgi:Na+/H+ antiporter NhaD/arsenite permease-like protein